jgi:hypothetical protein
MTLVPKPVRLWGGYRLWLAGVWGWGAWRSRGYRFGRYLVNVARDIEARMMGYCNHAPWPAQGGYAHWRCAYQRVACRAMGRHRVNNYTWARDGSGRVEYNPIPVLDSPTHALVSYQSRPYRERYLRRTLRQEIAWRRIMRADRVTSRY